MDPISCARRKLEMAFAGVECRESTHRVGEAMADLEDLDA
jgi:hypothetical protein